MKCPACGYDVADNDKKCQNCGQEFSNEARPISRNEIENFDGITIDSEGNKSEQGYSYHEGRGSYQHQEQVRPRVYVKQFGTSSLLTTLIIGVLIAAFIFFVLPTMLIIGLAIVAVWYILRMFM